MVARTSTLPHRSGFAARLRDATQVIHREAERTGFIADLIRGRTSRTAYALYLRNLVPVYASLEGRLQKLAPTGDRLIACFSMPGLARSARLGSDVEAIAGQDWRVACPTLPEAQTYARAIDRGDEVHVAAHAYARYLGDLSGGQILKPLLARTLKIEPDALAFYDFPSFTRPEVAKDAIHDALNTLDPAGADASAFINEAIAAFRCNIDLSLAVSRAVGLSVA